MAGLLDPWLTGLDEQEKNQAVGLGLLSIGSGLMGQNVPGGSIGVGLAQGAQQAAMIPMQLRQQNLNRMLMDAKIKELQRGQQREESWKGMFSAPQSGGTPSSNPVMSGVPSNLQPILAAMGPEAGSAFLAQQAAKERWEPIYGADGKMPVGQRSTSGKTEYFSPDVRGDKPPAQGMVRDSNGNWSVHPAYRDFALERAQAGRTVTNVDLRQDTAEAGEYGKALVKEYTDVRERAVSSQDAINQLRIAKGVISTSEVPSELQQAAGNLAVKMGVPLPETITSKITSGQAFQGVMQNLVLTKMQAQKGPQTENDAKRIESTVASLGNTPQARDFLMRAAEELASRDVEKEAFYQNWRSKKGSFDGAASAWRERESRTPMVGVNPKSGMPVFFGEFQRAMKQQGMKDQEVIQAWEAKYGR